MIRGLILTILIMILSSNVSGEDLFCAMYADEMNFWKDQYTNLSVEYNNLQNKIIKLEERLDDEGPLTISIGHRWSYDDIEIGYFEYDDYGNYNYHSLR